MPVNKLTESTGSVNKILINEIMTLSEEECRKILEIIKNGGKHNGEIKNDNCF